MARGVPDSSCSIHGLRQARLRRPSVRLVAAIVYGRSRHRLPGSPGRRLGEAGRMRSGIVLLFSLTTFLAAVLLFTAEPMIGNMVLPLFGGTPAVWNTCLVYFQLILLCGYAAFGGGLIPRGHEDGSVSPRYLVPLGILLAMACAAPPLAPDPGFAERYKDPAMGLFLTLVVSLTLQLLMVATTAPLIQNWFRLTGHPRAHDPYFLYAASNAGSLIGLLAYP